MFEVYPVMYGLRNKGRNLRSKATPLCCCAILLGEIVESKFQKSHAHLHIIGRMSTKFQVNPMTDVGGVAETRSCGTDGWTDGRNNAHMEGRGSFL